MPYSRRPLTLLLVDDDPGTRASLGRILRHDGYVVDEADSVRSLLDREDWSAYFVILLDRRLSDGTADELMPRLKELAPNAAIVVVTGHADIEGSIAALRVGAADYLLKPIEPAILRSRLTRLAELWRSRAAVAERDRQIQFMIDHLPAAAAYVDYERQTVRFNQVVHDLTGYTPEELSDLAACFEVLFPDEPHHTRRLYEQARMNEDWAQQPRALRIRHRDGSMRTVEFRGYRYDGHEVWMLQDITERDRFETELRIRDRAIQSATEGIVIADAMREGNPIIFANEAFQSITGFRPDEIIGRDCSLLCGESLSDAVLAELNRSVMEGEGFQKTVRFTCSDGRMTWIELSVAPVRNESGRISHLIAVMDDVSEQRNAQRQLLQSERLAAIGQVVTGLAHESRNALQRALACLDLLSLDLEELPEQLELTEKIRRALTDLERNYEEVRNYAAPINLKCRPVRLDTVWRRMWQDLEPIRFGHDIRLTETAVVEDAACNADEHRIEQVFRNIMENAIAACGESGTVIVSCTSASELPGGGLRVTFRDNGSGFSPESSAGVFQPFFTTKQKGTGLGMAIARRIVEAHGGLIGIGRPESGAEVWIELPQQPAAPESHRHHTHEHASGITP